MNKENFYGNNYVSSFTSIDVPCIYYPIYISGGKYE